MEYRPRDSHLDFLQELYGLGVDLPQEDVELLKKHDLVSEEVFENAILKGAKAKEFSGVGALDRYVLSREKYMDRCSAFASDWKDKEIERRHWKCDMPAEFSDGFVKFINSHFRRFCDLMAYEPFFLYMKQADEWLKEPTPNLADLDKYQRKKWWKKEHYRIRQNTLYALDRYVWVKESSMGDTGEMKYKANLAHAFVLFLFDDGRSVFAGKGRQMAFTTTLAAAAVIRMNFRPNTHVKLIACDLETTKEIYDDKVLYAFDRLEHWMKCKVKNKNGMQLRVTTDISTSKTGQDGYSSKVSIVAPKANAINGGAPDVVIVDEAAFLDIFDDMVKEARPTIWVHVNGKLMQRRQVWAFSTGGRSEKGNGSYEREHRDLFSKWTAKNFTNGIVPVFLDWTCRPGASEEWYLNEQKAYAVQSMEGHTDASVEEKMIVFRQHCPSSIEDMYSISRSTIVSPSVILKNEDKISRVAMHLRPQPGMFELVYDYSKTNPPDSILRHPVLGVNWVPMDNPYEAPAMKFMDPPKGWVYRTFQGTDPVMHDEGLSKHSSFIYDAHFRAPICMVNTRSGDAYQDFCQSIAMGMYYANDGERFCPELIESNIGKLLAKFKGGHEWNGSRSIVPNALLPDYLQGGSELWGIDTKAARKADVINIGTNYTTAHGSNNYFLEYWKQLRTFNPTTSKLGKTTWSVSDRRKNQDDVIDAMWFAYICRMCYGMRVPMQVKQYEEHVRSFQPQLVRTLDQYGRNTLVPVSSRQQKKWQREKDLEEAED